VGGRSCGGTAARRAVRPHFFPVWTFLVGNGYIFPEPPEGRRRLRWNRAFSGGFSRPVVRRIHKVASVQERVIDIVASQLGVSKEQITAETSFINDLGADSLDTVELVMELEEEFEINIPDDAAEKIQTVGQAVEFIEKHQA
jgi:acyl carrier protein